MIIVTHNNTRWKYNIAQSPCHMYFSLQAYLMSPQINTIMYFSASVKSHKSFQSCWQFFSLLPFLYGEFGENIEGGGGKECSMPALVWDPPGLFRYPGLRGGAIPGLYVLPSVAWWYPGLRFNKSGTLGICTRFPSMMWLWKWAARWIKDYALIREKVS